MPPLESESAGTPPATTGSETTQVMEKANTPLEVAVDIFKLLITENVPYLGIIRGCVERLKEIHKVVFCCVRYVY
jgi:hypothetical protein